MSFPEFEGAEDWRVPWGWAGLRDGLPIRYIVIHVMQGSYSGTAQWFRDRRNYDQSGGYPANTHYGVALDGRIAQYVGEQFAAYHAGNWWVNQRSLGIEHEDVGRWNSPDWWTEKQLEASARLVAHLCGKYGIPVDREHVIGHNEVQGVTKPCPGPNWPWERYMAIVRKHAGAAPRKKLYRVKVEAGQVGAFEQEANADGLIAALKRLGAKVVKEEVEVANPAPAKRSLVPPGFTPLPPRSGNYQDRHPTRYDFRPDVEALIRRVYERFGWERIHINTYVGHPEGWERDTTSFDVWGSRRRNDPIDPAIGDAVMAYLFNDPNPPHIDWIIYERKMWTRAKGVWEPYGTDVFSFHDDHIHSTYTGPYRKLA
jgi:N-acetyl-anhydromuramyl-L-alanine amidase AmpD